VLKISQPNGKTKKCTFLRVDLVPELAFNLFTVASASEKGEI